jgi:TetR/AcrR family transcriptional regulator, tetracycline repressor protein
MSQQKAAKKSRAGRQPLSAKLICDTAAVLIEQSGPDELSMRTLAKTLNVDPMAIYHYIPNKAQLINSVYESIVNEMFADVVSPVGWQAELKDVIHRFRTVAVRYPRTLPGLIAASHTVQGMARAIDVIYGILLRTGLSPALTIQASDTLFAFATGFVLLEVGGNQQDSTLPAPDAALPNTHRLAAELQDSHFAQSFEFGLDLVIAGIERHLAPPDEDTGNRRKALSP